jgi:hypothetical protein
MSRLAQYLALALVLLLVALGLALPLRLAYERGQVYDAGSSLRSDALGTRALYLLLDEERNGPHPERVRRPAPLRRGLLLSVRPVADERDAELLDWVREGNVLFLAAEFSGEVSRRASPEPRNSRIPSPAPSSSPAPQPEWMRREPSSLGATLGLALEPGKTAAMLSPGSPLQIALPDWPEDEAAFRWNAWPRDGRVLLGSAEQPVLVEFALGHGRVIALADAGWLTNAGLAHGERLRLVLEVLRAPRLPILFDEYRHGLAEQPGLAYVLARYGLIPTAFAALAFLALVAWRTSPAEAPLPPEDGERTPVRDSLVEARAGLYVRTLRPPEAAGLIERELRSGLQLALVQPLASWRDLRRRLGERRPALTGRLDGLRREIDSARADLRGGTLEELVPLMRRVARFIQEVR